MSRDETGEEKRMPVLSRFYELPNADFLCGGAAGMKTIFHKVVSVEALPDFVLGVRFAGGVRRLSPDGYNRGDNPGGERASGSADDECP